MIVSSTVWFEYAASLSAAGCSLITAHTDALNYTFAETD